MLDKIAVARALRDMAALLALKDNKWKARAFDNGARAVEQVDDLAARVEERRLTEIRGIGEALAAVIDELWRTGKSTLHDELRAELPSGALELAQLPSVGPKKAIALAERARPAVGRGAEGRLLRTGGWPRCPASAPRPPRRFCTASRRWEGARASACCSWMRWRLQRSRCSTGCASRTRWCAVSWPDRRGVFARRWPIWMSSVATEDQARHGLIS